MKKELIRFEDIVYREDEVVLLDYFNMYIFKGEVMGLLCVNAHGKDALIKLLCNNFPLYYGRIYFNEIKVNAYNYHVKKSYKVSFIEQKSHLIEDLTVAENIFVLRKGLKKFVINKHVLNKQFRIFSDEIGVNILGGTYVAELNTYERCVVELLKAVIAGTQLIIIQDISNYVGNVELEKFNSIMRFYCKKGISFLCMGNHHQELFKICDRVSIMQEGKIRKVLEPGQFTDKNMEPYVTEFNNHLKQITKNTNQSEEVLSFDNVTTNYLKNLSFSISKGECSVLLDNNNTVLSDILKIMNGEIVIQSGAIFVDNKRYTEKQSKKALKNGVAFIQEQPIKSMIFKEMSYLDNLCFLLDDKKERVSLYKRIKKSVVREYNQYVGNDIYKKNIAHLKVESLYNIVYYRIHLFNPKVVFCVQPFSGADMYHRFYIAELINKLKEKGITVIILTVNISDSFLVADKLVVIENGSYSAEYNCTELQKLINN